MTKPKMEKVQSSKFKFSKWKNDETEKVQSSQFKFSKWPISYLALERRAEVEVVVFVFVVVVFLVVSVRL